MAFNPKNLQYNKQEPAFLRKLKGEFGGLDGRHNVQIARPKKDRLKTGDDDEDEPVIVDEQGERIEKAEFERRVNGEGEDEGYTPATTEDPKVSELGAEQGTKQSERQRVAEIGSSATAKKRKLGKFVGGEGENQPSESDKDDKQRRLAKGQTDEVHPAQKAATAPKKKGKKIKLSFDEPES
ncbi:hypothetical protein A1O7_08993 [Cladophialophora yegresii CBS 114405]|uniref:DUF4604 domain-containing protein n=1 Tax=Cladophialophora yegresii CBS 114405 TaxID=1182544 RepID=W9VK45_9EURO|nr:uncharacterized protein A1O7_08993 [Cladophialophora yegresii CBS 114405]EXJ56062.1 hypothetical protein A1O7_08993 [Cladophialophora yegresii CBS 114405]